MKMRNSANNAWITLYQLDGEWTNIAFENGTAAAPSIYFKDSGTDTGFYSPGANQVGISTGGTARLTIDSNGNVDIDSNTLYVDATNNRVGLGTSSPSTQLTLNSSDTTGTGVRLENTSSGGYNWSIFSIGSAASLAPVGCLAFRDATNAATRLVIDPIGRVGIGVTSPGYLLHVEGGQIYANRNGAGTQQVLQLNNSDTTAGTQVVKLAFGSSGTTKASINAAVYGNDFLTFNTGSDTERARIDSSGRLLVGTSSAIASTDNNNNAVTNFFQVGGLGISTSSILLNNWSTSVTSAASLAFAKSKSGAVGTRGVVAANDDLGCLLFEGDDGTNFIRAASILAEVDGTPGTDDMPGRLVFSTTADGASSPTERMRISNTGYIWAYSTSAGFLQNVSAAAGTSTALFIGNRSATATDGSGGTTVYYVWSNGNVQNTNGSYTAISDAKLKENIVDSSSQWNDLKAIQIRNWNFKAETGHETHRQIGPIAQELEQVCPGLVFETPDRDADGNETGEVTKGVNQSVLYMKAVKALQEAMERIEQLETEMAEVKAQLQAL
jgi:hypothetical protein